MLSKKWRKFYSAACDKYLDHSRWQFAHGQKTWTRKRQNWGHANVLFLPPIIFIWFFLLHLKGSKHHPKEMWGSMHFNQSEFKSINPPYFDTILCQVHECPNKKTKGNYNIMDRVWDEIRSGFINEICWWKFSQVVKDTQRVSTEIYFCWPFKCIYKQIFF